jgi:hypothetical protein
VESLNRVAASEFARQDYLQSHDPVQLDLPSLVNQAHSTPSDLAEQFILAKVFDTFSGFRSGPRQEFRSIRIAIEQISP